MRTYVYWDLPEETVLLMVACGFARYAADENVYELTPEGSRWLERYCSQVIQANPLQAHFGMLDVGDGEEESYDGHVCEETGGQG